MAGARLRRDATESLVRESLFSFVRVNVPGADPAQIDEIALSYVVSILEEAPEEPCFDVDGFVETMSAYLPDFSTVDPALVCSWIFELEAELSRTLKETETRDERTETNGESDGVERITLALRTLDARRSRSESECSEPGGRKREPSASLYPEQCEALRDTFPDACPLEIRHCVSVACGDLERAAALVLHRRESGQARAAPPLPPPPPRTINDDELKTRIIDRYSYVDRDAELKEHRPLVPKIEPKKLVRYRDNKIVSLKGERYTEVSRSGDDEDAALKKPKRPHCPP